jgi:photosystem II stability/assembly factor-like uncharacterized protein
MNAAPFLGAPHVMKTFPSSSWGLVLLLLALRGTPASAHGGVSDASSNINVRRGSADDLILGDAIGAVVSRDRGRTWQWLCSEGMGMGSWRPERYFWLTGGDLLAATGSALLRSRDGGCTWSAHPFFQDTWVTNLAVHPTDERIMYVTTGRPSLSNGVYRSQDGGETWQLVVPPTTGSLYAFIRIAPSNPMRVYASGYDAEGIFLSRSDDGGQTWTRLPQPLPQFKDPYDLHLLLVSEASADVLWARVSAQGFSYLLKSTDGGVTLTQQMETYDYIVSAEASADGRTVWVSTPVRFFRGREGEPFSELPLPSGNACALRVGSTLYGCGSSLVHGWAMASSQDEGTTWNPIFSLSSIQGSYVCPAGTPVQQQCPSRWPQVAAAVGAPIYGSSDGGVPVPDAGTPPVEKPPAEDSCSTTQGLVPAALLLLSAALVRRSRRAPSST